jgi:hypothetical protein
MPNPAPFRFLNDKKSNFRAQYSQLPFLSCTKKFYLQQFPFFEPFFELGFIEYQRMYRIND